MNEQFLNPKSMKSPGAAGLAMMLATNTLVYHVPQLSPQYVALIVSFAIGAVSVSSVTMKIWERGIFWVVNSLIILSMGTGATNILRGVENPPPTPLTPIQLSKLLELERMGGGISGGGGGGPGGRTNSSGGRPSQRELQPPSEREQREPLTSGHRQTKDAMPPYRHDSPDSQPLTSERDLEAHYFFKRWF